MDKNTCKGEEVKVDIPKRYIKDLPEHKGLGGVRFYDPITGTVGYWVSQWGYENGKAGVWWKEKMTDTRVHPLCLDKLQEALQFEVVGPDFKPPKKPSRKQANIEREKYQAVMDGIQGV